MKNKSYTCSIMTAKWSFIKQLSSAIHKFIHSISSTLLFYSNIHPPSAKNTYHVHVLLKTACSHPSLFIIIFFKNFNSMFTGSVVECNRRNLVDSLAYPWGKFATLCLSSVCLCRWRVQRFGFVYMHYIASTSGHNQETSGASQN